jgi:hypothetical protein
VALIEPRPVQLVVSDDLARSRLTVFFRLLLSLPVLVVYLLWTIGAFFAAIAAWFVVLVRGRLNDGLHDFLASYVRYATRSTGYLYLVANPWPGFGTSDPYPVDVEIAGPLPQRRWTVVFRLFLALPALLLAAAAGGAGQLGSRAGNGGFGTGLSGGSGVSAILGWFASLATGRMPRGLRDLGAYGVGYSAQTVAYLLLLTDRYPSSEPRHAGPMALPDHPVELDLRDELARPRLLVFFRVLLALPHVVWLALWTVLVVLSAIAGWLAALLTGRLPRPLHRFHAAYVRYATHVSAFVHVVGGPFPGFVGAEGSYPVDIRIDPPAGQSRWRTGFRGILAVPALVLSSAYGSMQLVVAVLGWFSSLARAEMPEGMRNLGAVSLRYHAQTMAYLLFLTDRYPYAAPALEHTAFDSDESEPEVAPPLAGPPAGTGTPGAV